MGMSEGEGDGEDKDEDKDQDCAQNDCDFREISGVFPARRRRPRFRGGLVVSFSL